MTETLPDTPRPTPRTITIPRSAKGQEPQTDTPHNLSHAYISALRKAILDRGGL